MTTHNHFTRDIKPRGQCPSCDEYHLKTKGESQRREMDEVEFKGFAVTLGNILYAVIHLKDEYVLDGRYIRWGRIEREIKEAHEAALAAECARSKVLIECLDSAQRLIHHSTADKDCIGEDAWSQMWQQHCELHERTRKELKQYRGESIWNEKTTEQIQNALERGEG